MPRDFVGIVAKPVSRLADAFQADGLSGFGKVARDGLKWRTKLIANHVAPPRTGSPSTPTNPEPSAAAPKKSAPKPPPAVASTSSLTPTVGPGATAPLVSVIVTTLNRSELLPIALRSIQMQDLDEWECIVIDDGSTDYSVAAAQAFVDKDDRFSVIRHDRQRGLAAARNTGIAAAKAKFVCFLDDDDFLLSGSLAARLDAMEHAPVDVVGSFCDWINTDPHVQLEAFAQDRKPNHRGQISFTSLRAGVPFIATSPMIRRRALLDVGGFDETFRRAEDAELWHRLLRLGFKFVDARHVGVAYRRSPSSMVTGDPENQLDVLQSIENVADQPTPDLGPYGPSPVAEALAELTPFAVRAPTVYRYLAMISLQDVDRAVAIAHERIPAPVRSEIDPPALRSQLISYVRARCRVHSPHEVTALEAAVSKLITEIVPAPARSWESVVNVADWLASRTGRGQVFGATPTEVKSTLELLDKSVVLIVEAIYHIDELGPLARELEARGITARFMLSPKTVGPAISALGEYTSFVLSFAPDLIQHASAVVVLNDWGPVRELIEKANQAGIATFAKVEGVQDFADVDTGRVRNPYQTAAIILGQGPNDVASLPQKRVEIVGSSRLERIWNAPAVATTDRVLVNLNFTYHVLTDRRAEWMSTIRSAIDISGTDAVVSAHPAERSRNVGLPFAEKPFRYEITKSGVLVSRFSTVPFEAMARGVPFIYHNPHGELVPTFTVPNGAYRCTINALELAGAISEGLAIAPDSRKLWADFFLRQVDVDENQSSESRTADLIARVLGE